MKKLSVIIPCYNVEAYLGQCLQSIPDVSDIEIVLINDGSSDGTETIVRDQTTRRKNPMILRTLPENHGPSYARNVALSLYSGDAVLFLDADNYAHPDLFEHWYGTWQRESFDVIFWEMFVVEEDRVKGLFYRDKMKYDHPPLTMGEESLLLANNVDLCSIVSRETLSGNYFPEHVRMVAEWYFWLQLRRQKRVFRYISEPLAYYRWRRPGSVNRRALEQRRDHVLNLIKVWAENLERLPSDHPRRTSLIRRIQDHSIELSFMDEPMYSREIDPLELTVSFIIPQFTKAHLTIQCIESLQQHVLPRYPQSEIIVVDDGSPDDSADQVERYFGNSVLVLRSERNHGFSTSCNRGAEKAQGRYLVFLNNDTISYTDWLTPMLQAAQRPEVGLVGAKLLYPNHTVQHAGVEWYTGDVASVPLHPFHPYLGLPSHDPDVNRSGYRPMVTGACILIERDWFWAIEGFDIQYLMGAEDIDLCLKTIAHGKYVWYEAGAELIHLEQQTRRGPVQEERDWKNLLKLNRKWITHDMITLSFSEESLPETAVPIWFIVVGRNNFQKIFQFTKIFQKVRAKNDWVVWVDLHSDDGTMEFLMKLTSNNPDLFHFEALPFADSTEKAIFLWENQLKKSSRSPLVWWQFQSATIEELRKKIQEIRQKKVFDQIFVL